MNNIHNYFKTNSNELNNIIKTINDNNDSIILISNKINKLINKEDIMLLKIKINHIIIINKKLINKINNIKRKILLKKLKNIIKIFNEKLYKYLVNKNRDLNEELIFLYILSLEPNICDDVLNQLINKLIKLLDDLNTQTKYYYIKYN